MRTIPLVMTTDKNYIIPTRVAIGSMMESAKEDTFYEIHIMCGNGLDVSFRENLLELEEIYGRLKVVFHEIADSYFDKAKTHAYVPVASYYRLFISQFISADKCIFVDGDTLVNVDLGELYDIDLEDCYVAGVRDVAVQTKKKEFDHYEKILGIVSLDGYVNAGVLVFHLKKIREDGMDRGFMNAVRDGYRFMDQDIINKHCYGKIKHLPLRFNFFTEYYGRTEKMRDTAYSETELSEAGNRAGILHFVGTFKPWLSTRLKVNQLWWEHAKHILKKEDYEKQMEIARQFEKGSDWSYILDRVRNENEIIIVGFSEIGRSTADLLRQWKTEEIVCFCDNDRQKQGMELRGIRVMEMEAAVHSYPHAFWLITSQAGYVELEKQLKGFGVPGDKMLRYIYKGDAYYESLDERFEDYERQMLQHDR